MAERLARTDAIVWTGFFNESAAIRKVLERPSGRTPLWIDVSKGAARSSVPTSDCFGYVDPAAMQGDPFFWLNPRNGAVFARNIASRLGDIQHTVRMAQLLQPGRTELRRQQGTPGTLPSPSVLLGYVAQVKAQMVLVDPNTPPEYAGAFRQQPGLLVVEVPSSIERLPAKSYPALFENLLQTLTKSAQDLKQSAKSGR